MNKIYPLISALLLAIAATAQTPQLNLVQVATGFTKPTDVRNCGDDRLFVVDQGGKILIMSKAGVINATPFLDITSEVQSSGNEQGLLGLAFSPNYKHDGFFYVNYISGSGAGYTRVSRFSVSAADSNVADAGSERILFTFQQPYNNHNGGCVAFGADGYLYTGEGDGGNEYDPQNYGQNPNTYLSKIHRLDVSNPDTTYIVPADNPEINRSNFKPETWLWGLRNPWRFSFDRINGDLWIGDVGQDNYEEIDYHAVTDTAGQNYGWKCREGYVSCPTCNTSSCPGSTSGYTDPVYVYPHTGGNCSVTGGYVYRGVQYAALWGRYLFTDYCSGLIRSSRKVGNNIVTDTLGDFTNNQYTSFGVDNNGEMYLCYRGGTNTGRVYRLTETTNCNPVAFITLKDSLEGCTPFTISAFYGDTLSYQWYNSNGLINGATSYQYTVPTDGWYKVMVTKTNHAGCQAMSDSVYVTVRPSTTLTPCNCSQVACTNGGNVTLSNFVSPAGGVFSGPGVSGGMLNPVLAGVTEDTIAYTLTNQYGCTSNYSFVMELEDSLPITLASNHLQFCNSDAAISLNGYMTPIGPTGVYSGNGVSNDSIFNPSTAGVGTTHIQYSYVSGWGCNSRGAFDLVVGAPSQLTATVPSTNYCDTSSPFTLDGIVTPTGGTYSGPAVSNNMFSPSIAQGQGNNVVYYDYTNSYGCVTSDTFSLSVVACPTGINEITKSVSFQIFPNPSKGNFSINLQLAEAQNATLTVTDALGKVVFSRTKLFPALKSTVNVQLPNAVAGIYTVELKGTKGSAASKIVIE